MKPGSGRRFRGLRVGAAECGDTEVYVRSWSYEVETDSAAFGADMLEALGSCIALRDRENI